MRSIIYLIHWSFVLNLLFGFKPIDRQAKAFGLTKGSETTLDTAAPNPLEKFKGEWDLKGNVFENNTNGKYSAYVNPNRTFKALAVNTNTSILWSEDFVDFKVDIFWTYDIETKTVYHLSNTSTNGLASGKGPLKENGDLDIELSYPDACGDCKRIYSFRWKSDNEFHFRATLYKSNKSTGDYYGATFIRKN